MNRITNPFVRFILRSPLHGMMSAALLLITYRGKKTGREYTLPVQYAQEGKVIYIVPGMPEQKTWWRNLQGGLPVKLTLRGKVVGATGRLLDPLTDAAEILNGSTVYLRAFPALAKMYNVRIGADGSFDADDLRTAAEKVVMICVELG
jgi:hypothetical protein